MHAVEQGFHLVGHAGDVVPELTDGLLADVRRRRNRVDLLRVVCEAGEEGVAVLLGERGEVVVDDCTDLLGTGHLASSCQR